MARASKQDSDQPGLLEARVSTAPCVAGIRRKVRAWRADSYRGVTDTTRLLLNYWFRTDHRQRNGQRFAYYLFRREAVETLVYLFDVEKIRRHKSLVETYATRSDLRLLQYDDFARYCVKMATGSGKTQVVSLSIAWQFFNAVAEARDDFAKSFLVIAPNVIVFERLRTDFEGGRVFRADPIIPPRRAGEMTAVLGQRPPAQTMRIEDFGERIAARGGPVAVVNDEAHHTHDEESEWNKIIRALHADVSGGVAAQFDFTATPRHSKGQLFSWTVFDYPLKQAIIDNVVKRPLKGVAQGITEQRSDIANTRYQAYLAAGVERWMEYREQLSPLGKRPALFVMMNHTDEADDVGDCHRKNTQPNSAATDS